MSFSKWIAEGAVNDERRTGARLGDVKNLTKLTALYLEIPHVNKLPKDLFSRKSERYYIFLGGSLGNFMDGSNRIGTQLGIRCQPSIKEAWFSNAVEKAKNLHLNKFNGLKKIIWEIDKEGGLSSLKSLLVCYNDEIQYIVHNSSMEPHHISDHSVLPSFERFVFVDMENLERYAMENSETQKVTWKMKTGHCVMV